MNRRQALLSLLTPLAAKPLSLLATPSTEQGWHIPTLRPQLQFPRDHYTHNPFRNEWWDYSGHLTTTQGRKFSYQLTFFRHGLIPPNAPQPESAFLNRNLPFAHLTLTDHANQQFHSHQIIRRANFQRAGFHPYSQDQPRIAWIDNWHLDWHQNSFQLQAHSPDFHLQLNLTPQRSENPWTLHGEHGLSRKTQGNQSNSIYYSCTRLQSQGSLHYQDQDHQLEGSSWFDREWSSQLLPAAAQGWDWFALQLDDGREIMLFQLRDQDGNRLPGGHGTLINQDGRSTYLTPQEFTLTPLEYWRSPHTDTRYPIRWSIDLPNDRIQVIINAAIPDQELNIPSAKYWKGAIDVLGQYPGKGTLEMTGYNPEDAALNGLR